MTGIQEVLIPEMEVKSLALPDRLIAQAVAQNLDADKLGKLMELKLRWEADEARKQFEAAFSLFKRNAPKILKNAHVKFTNRDGSVTEYWHAKLDELTQQLGDALRAVGITMAWDSGADGSVTCVLNGFGHTHRGATLTSPPDKSGGKNDVQAVGSRSAYLMRYTALMTVGEVPAGAMPDDDGRSSEIMPDQAIEDYCIAFRDETDLEKLKAVFGEAYKKATALKDQQARNRLAKVYEEQKREILGSRQ